MPLDETALLGLRPAKPKRLPTVLSKVEARTVIQNMDGVYKLMVRLLYGSGLRLMECLRLRLKDLDFQNRQIIVRDGKACPERSRRVYPSAWRTGCAFPPRSAITSAPYTPHAENGEGRREKTLVSYLSSFVCLSYF
jgi:integrase